jgi:HSP20 family molecular chaperone IbpA
MAMYSTMYSYDQVLTDVRQVYEQLTGLRAPKVEPKSPRFPLPQGVDPVSLVQSEINYLNLFLINSGISLRLSKTPVWTPRAEVYKTPNQYVVTIDLAGIAPADYQVQHIDNAILVNGTRRFEKKSEDAQYLSSERMYGAFERVFPLPPNARPENMQTNLSNGALEITVPIAPMSPIAAKPGDAVSSGTQVKKATPQGIGPQPGQDKEKKG